MKGPLRGVLAVAVAVVMSTAAAGCTGGDGDADGAGTTVAGASSDTGATTAGGADGEEGAVASGTDRTERPATTRGPATSGTGAPAASTSVTAGTVEAPVPDGCAQLGPIPSGAVARTSSSLDADGDGAADEVTAYAIGPNPGEGDWHLRVSFAAGGGSDITLAEDPAPGVIRVLGSAYLGSTVEPGPGGLRPALFVWTGSGASARVVGLYRVDGCELAAMTSPTGGPAGFVVGASVGHQEGLRCEGVAGTSLLVEVLSEPDATGSSFAVTRRAYTRDGNALVVYGEPQDAIEAVPPLEAGQIVGCGDVRVPG